MREYSFAVLEISQNQSLLKCQLKIIYFAYFECSVQNNLKSLVHTSVNWNM